MSRTVDLNALRLFATIARHLNFRRAALALGMSPAALSERLRELETRMGVRLLNRTTRSVALTEAGRSLLETLDPALAAISAAIDAVGAQGASLTGTLRINAPLPAMEFRLGPLAIDFLAEHPGMKMELVVDANFIDVVAAGFDAGVRYEESLAQDMVAVSLGAPQRFRVVGAPAYFARAGRPEHPRDLARHACFGQLFPSGQQPKWVFEKDGQAIAIVPRGPLASSDVRLQLRAARQGLGLAATFEEWCQPDLDAGLLESVLDDWNPPFPGPYLYYPERRLMPAGLRAFVDFIRARNVGEGVP
ncbi:LysR family transcriptional regulator [Humitalea sp. 24SJ18S-53]|uniref:LysR family transcriptional regulator n=1 Tax=Humitalea sp. 24SJ18S-53 TaxID=3422307 RepID=UPI003D66EE33